jgi:uncharacterized Zn finger protein
MVKADLIIKCWQCGKEETVVEMLEESVVDFNLDKRCPQCGGWMTKKELTITRSAQIELL